MNSDTDAQLQLIKRAKKLIADGSFAAAFDVCQQVLAESSEQPEALYCAAVSQRKLQRHSKAFEILDRLHASYPQHSPGYQERGYNYLAQDRIDEAMVAFETAVELNPALHGSWRALSKLPAYKNNALAQQRLQWLSSLPAELVSSTSFMHQGQLVKAEALCRQFLKMQPHHPEAMRLLAQLASKFNILDDAEFLLESCIEFHPGYTPARLDYVEVLHKRQKFHLALSAAQALVNDNPSNWGFEISLANALQATGDYAAAVKSYQRVLEHLPNNHSVYLSLGHGLKTAGQTEKAIAAYQASFTIKADYGEAYWSLANLKTYQFTEAEISTMQKLEGTERIAAADRIHLCFAIGKALEDQRDFDSSFSYYQRGNQLKHHSLNYEQRFLTREIESQKQVFSQDFFNSLKGSGSQVSGCQASDPIFIVGLPRAGSTLIEQIIASHSEIDGTMELANVIAMANSLNGRRSINDEPRYPKILTELTDEKLRNLGEKYLQETKPHRQGAKFFIDKMPNNFRHLGLIKLILPNAKIIDARREPMACCFSGYKQLFSEGQEFSYSLRSIGSYYQQYVGLMDHWDQVLPGKILKVQHEDVIEDLEAQVRRILEFLELPFEQACVDFHTNTRAVRTPSSEQVRQPIFKESMHQWQNYEAHLQPLIDALGDVREYY